MEPTWTRPATAAPATAAPATPSPPASRGALASSLPAADLAAMQAEMKTEQQLRDKIFPLGHTAGDKAVHAIHAFQCGEMADAARLLGSCSAGIEAMLAEIAETPRPWYTRDAPSIAGSLENFACASCLAHFFSAGALLPRASLPSLRDQEYLLGVMALCQELSRYAIERATSGDAGSVLLVKELVGSTFAKLAEFDFRNGPLRRKFDGIKYVVRKCEDLLYELSLSGKYVASAAAPADEPAAKKAKSCPEFPRIVASSFDEMRATNERVDARREELIKRTRDIQKLSKQSIYSLHRSNFDQAEKQLSEATAKAQAIADEFLTEHPTLRQGSYACAMEEYAEARLTQVWLKGWFEDSVSEGEGKAPLIAGPSHESFHGLVNTEEYLGGVADFTGEIGRFAVQAASRRDKAGVLAVSSVCPCSSVRFRLQLQADQPRF
jgi:predicted translin family RNA/ssDNA-binding protein